MARYIVIEFPNDNTDERVDLWMKGFREDIAFVTSDLLHIAQWAIGKSLAQQQVENDG